MELGHQPLVWVTRGGHWPFRITFNLACRSYIDHHRYYSIQLMTTDFFFIWASCDLYNGFGLVLSNRREIR
jgi:hypothetical protein